MIRAIGIAALALLVTVHARADDWPQWRGPAGTGVSQETSLPVKWQAGTDNLRWNVPVPGEGASSPIVSGGRVFLTTAYPGYSAAARRWEAIGAGGVATLLLAALAILHRRRRKPESPAELVSPPDAVGSIERWAARIDALGVWLATLGFLASYFVAVLAPEWLMIRPGQPGVTWLASGEITLVGLAAAVGWLRFAGLGRVAGAVVLVAAAIALGMYTPLSRYGTVTPFLHRFIMTAPALVAAQWYVATWALFRVLERRSDGQSWRSPFGAIPLFALAGYFFAMLNFWQPQAGLQRAVVCYDFESGELLWDVPVFAAVEEPKGPGNTFATPTPCSDGQRVFADFGAGAACLDFDGRVLWQQPNPEFASRTRYGAAASPTMTDDAFILPRISESREVPGQGMKLTAPSTLAALDKQSGEPRWQVEPAFLRDSYASPFYHQVDGRGMIVLATWETLAGFDPASGELLWQGKLPQQTIVPSPAAAERLIVVSSGAEGGPRVTVGMGLDDRSSDSSPSDLQPVERWSASDGVPNVPSPVIATGLLFVVSDNGVLSCLDAASGQRRWKERIPGDYLASLVAAGGNVYATNTAGVTTVFAAADKYREVARNSLEGIEPAGELDVKATPALASGRIILRTRTRLICIE